MNSPATRQRRAEKLRNDPSLATHGLRSTYQNWHCRCNECRAAQSAAARLNYKPRTKAEPDDIIDDVAIERAMTGEPVTLTPAERVEAIRRMAAAGVNDAQIAKALWSSPTNVKRWRNRHGIPNGLGQ